jgi:hypothetical protein
VFDDDDVKVLIVPISLLLSEIEAFIFSSGKLFDAEISYSSCLRLFIGEEETTDAIGGGYDSRIFAFASSLAKLLI